MQHSPRKFWEVWGRSDALYNRWAAAHGVNNYRLFVLYVLDNHCLLYTSDAADEL